MQYGASREQCIRGGIRSLGSRVDLTQLASLHTRSSKVGGKPNNAWRKCKWHATGCTSACTASFCTLSLYYLPFSFSFLLFTTFVRMKVEFDAPIPFIKLNFVLSSLSTLMVTPYNGLFLYFILLTCDNSYHRKLTHLTFSYSVYLACLNLR